MNLFKFSLWVEYHILHKKINFYGTKFHEKKIVLAPAESIVLSAPKNINQIQSLWNPPSWFKEKQTNGIVIYSIKNAYITSDGVIVKKFESFSPSIVYPNFKKRFNHEYVYHQLKKTKIKLTQPVYLIWDHWAKDNYFHWVVDSLTRLVVAQENGVEIALVMNEDMPAFIWETLKAFSDVKVIMMKYDKLFLFKQIYLPRHIMSSGFVHPYYAEKIRAKILSYSNKLNLPLNKGNKIYVSRGKQKNRKIINEDQLIEVLKKNGFSLVFFEDYTFWEQVTIMSYADVLISSHGSNMVNMLFMKKNSKIIEINQADSANATLCYWSMAEALGFRYYYVPTEVKNSNYWVDLKYLNSVLNTQI